jgi:hypothetical protein
MEKLIPIVAMSCMSIFLWLAPTNANALFISPEQEAAESGIAIGRFADAERAKRIKDTANERVLPTFEQEVKATFQSENNSVEPIEKAPSFEDGINAAMRLKASSVKKEYENCLATQPTQREDAEKEFLCKKILENIHEREKKALLRISKSLVSTSINLKRASVEMSACYGFSEYGDRVMCWQNLADRLDAALNGETLLKKE